MAIFSAMNANKAKRAQRAAQRKLDATLARRNAREVINPYDQVSDLSNMIYNPMANLQVATGAAVLSTRYANFSLDILFASAIGFIEEPTIKQLA